MSAPLGGLTFRPLAPRRKPAQVSGRTRESDRGRDRLDVEAYRDAFERTLGRRDSFMT